MPLVTEFDLLSLAGARDIIIIVAGSLIVLLLVALLAFTVVIGLATRVLLGTVRRLLDDEVSPLVNSTRLTVRRVQGTTTFMGETAVGPVIRVYGVFAGARRAFGVLTGVAGRRNQRK